MLGRRKRLPPRVVLTRARRGPCVGIRVAYPDLPIACFAATRLVGAAQGRFLRGRRVVGLVSPAECGGKVRFPEVGVEERVWCEFDPFVRSPAHRGPAADTPGLRESGVMRVTVTGRVGRMFIPTPRADQTDQWGEINLWDGEVNR